MAIALINIREFKRTIKLYEDVLCLFFYNSSDPLTKEITKGVEEIINKAHKLTDSLIKIIKIEIDTKSKFEDRVLQYVKIDKYDCPVVCYFKEGKLVGKHTKTFTNHLLKSWINQFFYEET